MGAFETPKTEKKAFIKAIDKAITAMKKENHITYCYEHTVICKSETSDADLELWNITFHNGQGRKFKAYIIIKIKWKNGNIDTTKTPFEEWNSKKEFMEFIQRECDK